MVRVSATDEDQGPAGEVTYLIDSSQDNFYIEPRTGQVKVSPNAVLDLERSPPSYQLRVSITKFRDSLNVSHSVRLASPERAFLQSL